MTSVRGVVINVHEHGATVRLEDGTLAAVPAAELALNRPAILASRERRSSLDFALDRSGRHPIARLSRDRPEPAPPHAAPNLTDTSFEERIGAYLKSTESWAPTDRPEPAERHFIRKKRRAAFFEARTKTT
ncbi:MAG: hypothetical protein IAI50_19245 [Candidatus Eremiobacteraeota bacterium]|nr:hypothetical protein [Candidatus Eremiobacteraeota bacterium]